jgi:hypothetical protein
VVIGENNGKLMEKCVSNEYVFVCDCNGKMVERLDVFVVSLFYKKMWKVK